AARAFCTAGSSSPTSAAMMAITTRSSISVKPGRWRRDGMAMHLSDGGITNLREVIRSVVRSSSGLLAEDLDEHPLRPIAIELAVEDLLPRAEVELAPG